MAGTPDQAWAKNGEKNHESMKGGAGEQGALLLRTEALPWMGLTWSDGAQGEQQQQ